MKLSDTMDLFLNEMKSDLEKDYQEFCFYQEAVQKTLSAFHEVCIRNGVTYYLAYGSLLGAIRDNGQIPWDYDIDVWVPFNQAQKLMNALDKDLSQDYHYITRFKDPNYRTYTLKLAPKEYDCEVLHVDVFWLTGAHDDPTTNAQMHLLKRKHHNISLIKYCPKKYLGISGKIPELMHALRRVKCEVYSRSYMERMFQRIMGKPIEESALWTDNEEPKEFPCEWFAEPKRIRITNGMEFCVPSNYEAILKMLYGDYLAVPDIRSRTEEFQTALRRIRALGKLTAE